MPCSMPCRRLAVYNTCTLTLPAILTHACCCRGQLAMAEISQCLSVPHKPTLQCHKDLYAVSSTPEPVVLQPGLQCNGRGFRAPAAHRRPGYHGGVVRVHMPCYLPHNVYCCNRGQRAVAEASERLQRAMERADAELEEAQRSRRGSRSRHFSPRREREEDSNGLHRAGYTAEHDYDR